PPLSRLQPAATIRTTRMRRTRQDLMVRRSLERSGVSLTSAMVAGLAFLATAVATLFAEATFVRWRRNRTPHEGAWTIALCLFALASAALATGASTGWDRGSFRVFYLLGAIVNVPWLALGTVYLLMGRKAGDRLRVVLVMFTGIGLGVMLAAPMHGTIVANRIPVGKDVFGALP